MAYHHYHRHIAMYLLLVFEFLLSFTPRYVLMLDVYNLQQGENKTIPFDQHLSSKNSEVNYELFLPGKSRPFYVDGDFYPDGLNEGQQHRLNVTVQQSHNTSTLLINLTIWKLITTDEGLYILSLTERKPKGEVSRFIQDAYIYVKVPPGRASCEISLIPFSAYQLMFLEIQCHANDSSDASGILICFQHDANVLYQQPVQRRGSEIYATFWMLSNFPINCCSSYEGNAERTSATCADFIYAPPARKFPTTMATGLESSTSLARQQGMANTQTSSDDVANTTVANQNLSECSSGTKCCFNFVSRFAMSCLILALHVIAYAF